ncbi:MAG TPA: exonuclease domain-containing protein [Bacillota bacterium]
MAGTPAGLACFVDVETTGLNPRRDEVVELACVLFAFDWTTGEIHGVVDTYQGLRQPSVPIPPAAARIHGLSDNDVRGHDLDYPRLRAMLARAEFVVAHNASFDRAFVARLIPEALQRPWYCSMRGVDWYRRGFRSRGLQPLLRAHRLDGGRAHRAGSDAVAAVGLLASRDPRNPHGPPYFSDLLRSITARAAAQPPR